MSHLKQTFIAEWRRFFAAGTARRAMQLFAVALCACALASGFGARAWHAKFQQLEASGHAAPRLAEARAAPASPGQSPDQAAMAAFRFARSEAPPALLRPAGGLALGSGLFDLLPPAIRVTVESRHTDARNEEKLANPLLQRYGTFDLATAIALLVPLVLVCLCAGIVQGERERGTWRMSVANGAAAGCVLAAAMAVRAGAVWGIAALASALAFLLDPAATLVAYLAWMFCVTAFVACWSAASAALNLLPGPGATAVLAGLGLWAIATFGTPAMISALADRSAPMPSRLAAIVQIRSAQQHAETSMPKLVEDWYRAHPGWLPGTARQHTWPVTYMPRYLDQQARIQPVVSAFDRVRAARFEQAQRWAWLSPSLSLLLAADRLAGSDAPRYASFMAQVDSFEARWRAFFVPRIMSYRGVAPAEYRDVPRFAWTEGARTPAWHGGLQQLALAAAILGLIFLLRARLARP